MYNPWSSDNKNSSSDTRLENEDFLVDPWAEAAVVEPAANSTTTTHLEATTISYHDQQTASPEPLGLGLESIQSHTIATLSATTTSNHPPLVLEEQQPLPPANVNPTSKQSSTSSISVELETGDLDPLGAMMASTTTTDPAESRRPTSSGGVKSSSTTTTSGGSKSVSGRLEIQVLDGIKVSSDILAGAAGGGHIEYSVCVKRTHYHHTPHVKGERDGKEGDEQDVWAHKGSSWSVMRRYSDFLFLYSVLVAGCVAPGRIVPGIPGKESGISISRNFDREFVETRRKGLEGWIRQVAGIADFTKCDVIVFFLSSETFSADKKSWIAEKKIKESCILPWTEYLPLPPTSPLPTLSKSSLLMTPQLSDLCARVARVEEGVCSLQTLLVGMEGVLERNRDSFTGLSQALHQLSTKVSSSSSSTNTLTRRKCEFLGEMHASQPAILSIPTQPILFEMERVIALIGSIKHAINIYNILHERITTAEGELGKASVNLERYRGQSVRVDKVEFWGGEVVKWRERVQGGCREAKLCGERICEGIEEVVGSGGGVGLGGGIEEMCRIMKERVGRALEAWKGYHRLSIDPKEEVVEA